MVFSKKYVFSIFLTSSIIFLSGGLAKAQSHKTIQTVLIAEQEAMIASPVSGRISKLPFHDGDLFKKGDILAAFDCKIEKAQLRKMQAQLEIATTNLKAQQKLQELNANSKVDFLISRATERRARAEVGEYNSRLNLCTIKAPFAGRVTGQNANSFETTEAGTPLLKISSLENLQAQILVPSSWLSNIKIGSVLNIKIHENNKTYTAHIIRIGGAVDAVSQSIMMVAKLDEKQKELLPGMSGTAIFKIQNKNLQNPAPSLKVAPDNNSLPEKNNAAPE